jgi:hypothetical protein
MTRNELRDYCGQCMVAKGQHDDGSGFVDGALWRTSLVLTEVAEATQEFKRHWGKASGRDVVERIVAECADTCIRLYDLAFWLKVDLDQATAMDSPMSVGVTERFKYLIRCGQVAESVVAIFNVMRDVLDMEEEDPDIFRDEEYGYGMEYDVACSIVEALSLTEAICRDVGGDINTAIMTKMAENMARPHKYGTPDAEKGVLTESQYAAFASDPSRLTDKPFSFQPAQG